ncbi:hypothetical protein D9M68_518470 [compost metagenome]
MQAGDDVQAAELGNADIENHQVRQVFPRQRDGVDAVVRFRHDFVAFASQQQAYGETNHRVVIDDQYLVGGLVPRLEEIIQIDQLAHGISPLARFCRCQDREAHCTVDPREGPEKHFRNTPTPP